MNNLTILLIGKGAREHALAWKLNQSPTVNHIFVLPGNGGTAQGMAKVSNIDNIPANDYPSMVKLAQKLGVRLVVVGPDDAVCDGIEGHFRESGIPCFAPTKEAAELEGSKTYAKDFMQRHGVPTAEYRNFSDYELAREYLTSITHRVVIKVSGLAAGKGVVLPANQEEAQEALRDMMVGARFGDAGNSIVIEEYLEGHEISVLTLSDGITTKTLSPGQDHKRIFDGDKGPNTGGMGVYAPTSFASADVMAQIEETILKPTFEGLKSEGRTFVGMLFTGVMLTASGPKVLEYNTRFGDPETQSVIPLLSETTDLAAVLLACTQGKLGQVVLEIQPRFACNVVIAAGGYPDSHAQGDRIELGSTTGDVLIFHAGTKLVDGNVVTAGGRVLAVVAIRDSLDAAVTSAYNGVRSIKFRNMFYRKDIASRALQKES